MTNRRDRLRYFGGAHGEARLLREGLLGFHACVSAEDAVDPTRVERWQSLAPPRLCQGTGVDLTMEAAWALLARWEGMDASDDTATDDAAAARTLVRGLLATMPPLIAWLRYIEQVPSGEAMEAFRRRRRETILRWLPHVHPDEATLAEYVRGAPSLPAFVRAGISAHVRGPYHCLACKSVERRLSAATRPAEAPQRLVAASATNEPHRHEAIVRVRDQEHRFRMSFLADGGFLRVFASYEGERTLPTTAMKLAVVFRTGHVREGTVIYPDHGLLGANLGALQGLLIDEITSFSLEP